MALKDWKKRTKGYWDKAEGYSLDEWVHRNKLDNIYIEKSTEDNHTFYYVVFNYKGIRHEKVFNKRNQALKFTKQYMKTH